MYGVMFLSSSPTVPFNSHGIGTAKNFGTKVRSFSATRHFPYEDAESDSHGFSTYRRLLEASSSLPTLTGDFRALPAVETIKRPTFDISEKTRSKTAIRPLLELSGGADGGDDDGGRTGRVRIGCGHADSSDDDGEDKSEDEDGGGGVGGGDEDSLLSRRRPLVADLNDEETIEAILREWIRTTKDLSFALKKACVMGTVSSAESSKFLWFNLRPPVTRLFACLLPQGFFTDFNRKVMADPSVLYKLGFEAVCSVCRSVGVDISSRKSQRTKTEWDSVLTNAILNAFCIVLAIWSFAPCNGLVTEVFEKSRNLGVERSLLCFFRKAAAVFAVSFPGKSAGQVCLSGEKITAGSLGTESKDLLEVGISYGLFLYLRNQLIQGIDRSYLYFNVASFSLAFCLALRFLNIAIGTLTPNWVASENQANCFDLGDSVMSHVGDGLSCNHHWFDLRNFIATETDQLVAENRG